MMKVLKKILLFLILMLASFSVLAFIQGYNKYKDALKQLPIEDAVIKIQEKKNYTEIDDISDTFVDAMVAVEDRRFFSHNGFDIVGTLRAIATDIKERALKEGGSTISQQLAKNIYFPLDNTLDRKIAEIMMAIELEKAYSKEEILELYFNTIYYGSGYYCIYDASMGYFKKTPAKMTSYESTLLAGVPNAPSVYSPKVNLDLAHQRQKKVLSSMVSTGKLTKEQKDEILKIQENHNK